MTYLRVTELVFTPGSLSLSGKNFEIRQTLSQVVAVAFLFGSMSVLEVSSLTEANECGIEKVYFECYL